MGNQLVLRVVEVETPEWNVAVENKRQRAFATVEKDGISREEIEKRYDAYREDKGISFHDERLRQEVGSGQLFTWWQEGEMVAYAPAMTSRLIGNANHGVFNVADIWAQPGLNSDALQRIMGDLLEQARHSGAIHVQVYCDHELESANLALGGQPIKHWFQFDLAK